MGRRARWGKQFHIDYDTKPIHPHHGTGTKHGQKSAASVSWHAGGSDFLIRRIKRLGQTEQTAKERQMRWGPSNCLPYTVGVCTSGWSCEKVCFMSFTCLSLNCAGLSVGHNKRLCVCDVARTCFAVLFSSLWGAIKYFFFFHELNVWEGWSLCQVVIFLFFSFFFKAINQLWSPKSFFCKCKKKQLCRIHQSYNLT